MATVCAAVVMRSLVPVVFSLYVNPARCVLTFAFLMMRSICVQALASGMR